MVIGISSNDNSNNSNKVDLQTEKHHKKRKKKHVNIERNYFIVNVTNPKWKC